MAVVIQQSKGMVLTELLMVIAVIIICLTALVGAFSFALKVVGQEKAKLEGVLLGQELMEGLRSFRDNTDWTTNGLVVFTNGAVYHLEPSPSPTGWQISAGEGIDGQFSHQLVFYEVRRDANSNIVEGGGVFDSKSKKAVITISWPGDVISLTGLFTDWQ